MQNAKNRLSVNTVSFRQKRPRSFLQARFQSGRRGRDVNLFPHKFACIFACSGIFSGFPSLFRYQSAIVQNNYTGRKTASRIFIHLLNFNKKTTPVSAGKSSESEQSRKAPPSPIPRDTTLSFSTVRDILGQNGLRSEGKGGGTWRGTGNRAFFGTISRGCWQGWPRRFW